MLHKIVIISLRDVRTKKFLYLKGFFSSNLIQAHYEVLTFLSNLKGTSLSWFTTASFPIQFNVGIGFIWMNSSTTDLSSIDQTSPKLHELFDGQSVLLNPY
jgi:hypothetical protein